MLLVNRQKIKLLFFWTGTGIIIITTFIFSYKIPTLNEDIQKIDVTHNNTVSKIDTKLRLYNDFQLTEVEGTNYWNALTILDSMNLQGTEQYQKRKDELNTIVVHSLILLAKVAGVEANEQLVASWKGMSFNQQQREKEHYALLFAKELLHLDSEKDTLIKDREELRQWRSKINLYAALSQVIALLLLAFANYPRKDMENIKEDIRDMKNKISDVAHGMRKKSSIKE